MSTKRSIAAFLIFLCPLASRATCSRIDTLRTIFTQINDIHLEQTSFNVVPFEEGALKFDRSAQFTHYAKDLDGNFYGTSQELPVGSHTIILNKDSRPLLIVESGKIEPKGPGKRIEFKQLQGENEAFVKSINCKSLSSAAGKKIFSSYLKANLATTGVGIAVSEIFGSGRLLKNGEIQSEGVRLVGSEMGTAAAGSLIGAKIAQALSESGAGPVASYGTRLVVGLGMNRLNRLVNSHALEKNGDLRSKRIQTFNDIHTLVRVPINHAFDQFLIKQLPEIAERACLNGSPLQFLLSPTSIRVFERFASSAIYYQLRSESIGE